MRCILDDITINITLTNLEVLSVFVSLMILFTSIVAINNHWKLLKSLVQQRKTLIWLAVVVFGPLFLVGLWQIFLTVTNQNAVFANDPRGYAVLLAAIVGAPFIIWRTLVAQRSANTDEQGLITDRIAKAVEQLGASKVVWTEGQQSSEPNFEVRLGGIYSLERIALDSLRDHIPIMEILCAYVRENSPVSNAKIFPDGGMLRLDAISDWAASIPAPRNDIQAIIDVISRRNNTQIELEENLEYTINLSKCNLQRVSFADGNFEYAQFHWSFLSIAYMEGVSLNNAEFYFSDLSFTDLINAKLENCDFESANCVNTTVTSTDLSKTLNLNQTQLDMMLGDASTNTPQRTKRSHNWSAKILESSEIINIRQKDLSPPFT